MTRTLPLTSETSSHVSPAAVVILAAVGRISDVAFWVIVKAPIARHFRRRLAAVPNEVTVVVPEIATCSEAAPRTSQVAAEATVTSASKLPWESYWQSTRNVDPVQ